MMHSSMPFNLFSAVILATVAVACGSGSGKKSDPAPVVAPQIEASPIPEVQTPDKERVPDAYLDPKETDGWKDVTNGGCEYLENRGHCRYYDKATGLEWSEMSTRSLDVETATSYCSGNFDGVQGWRLASIIELLDARAHGIVENARYSLFDGYPGALLWSSMDQSSEFGFSDDSSFRLAVDLEAGGIASFEKTHKILAICVRQKTGSSAPAGPLPPSMRD